MTIDPTAGLPLHFTLETVVLSTAALFSAWAVLRRRIPAAIAGVALTLVEGLHAGQFIEADDDPVLIGVRLASLTVIAILMVPVDPRRVLLGSGIGTVFVGAAWAAFEGGGPEELAIAPHVVMAGGAIAVLVWVWHATRPSVRLRVLAAFICVLGVAVVVAGGAVARVAAVDARNERYQRLGLEASTMIRNIVDVRDVLRRRAATLSPVVARGTQAGSPVLERSRVLAGEWVVVVDKDLQRLTAIAAEGVKVPHTGVDYANVAVVRQALEGDVSSATSVTSHALQLIATSPIFRPGGTQTAKDVIGVVVVGQTLPAEELQVLAADPAVAVAVIDPDDTDTTDAGLGDAVRATVDPAQVQFDTVHNGGMSWLATSVPVPSGNAHLIVATPSRIVVEVASDLVRAFLVAVLAAALLAVIAALWLSARITRPMLQLADDAERVKADFLASVSHELRTPLTPIRGYTEILRSRSVPARDASGYLDEIGLAAQRLERVVALLVDVASIEAGRFRVLVEPVPPADIVNSTIDRWAERTSRGIELRVPRQMPNVLADAPAVARVLDELIDNAMKFAPDGEVELRARRVGNGIELSVRDNGPGIDPERLKAVREAFHQEDSGDTRRFGGLGLGLTFVEGVLDAHGARLDISSVPGSGTTCSFVLPAAGSVTRMPPKAQTRKRTG